MSVPVPPHIQDAIDALSRNLGAKIAKLEATHKSLGAKIAKLEAKTESIEAILKSVLQSQAAAHHILWEVFEPTFYQNLKSPNQFEELTALYDYGTSVQDIPERCTAIAAGLYRRHHKLAPPGSDKPERELMSNLETWRKVFPPPNPKPKPTGKYSFLSNAEKLKRVKKFDKKHQNWRAKHINNVIEARNHVAHKVTAEELAAFLKMEENMHDHSHLAALYRKVFGFSYKDFDKQNENVVLTNWTRAAEDTGHSPIAFIFPLIPHNRCI
ncbi:hypothetical protein BDP27DRAFT_1414161 [Rhodocollybia butyracea]|uniref:Uncharacterized protein n=1 Tax=Rhodocollybia butyracea TaxID=206335 RepID=A0A9P5Q867_9AGAR|nr:hypothetical protein BDP27DRAFT_1414161 [Rhodocollybia butyracea]